MDVVLGQKQWHKIETHVWQDAFPYFDWKDRFQHTEGLSGFMVSTPHSLQAAGSYEIRVKRVYRWPGKTSGSDFYYDIALRNVDVHWRVIDDIDANSCSQYNWKKNSKTWGAFETLVVDPLGDKTLSASYRVRIFFHEQTPEELEATVYDRIGQFLPFVPIGLQR
jgi:hypothetical protein